MNRRTLIVVGSAIYAYLQIATAGHDPSRLIWDWVAFEAMLTAAGFAQPDVDGAPVWRQIVTAIGAFILGYGQVMDSTGFRYGIAFNLQGVMNGLIFASIAHSNNTSLPVIGQALKAPEKP